MSETMPRYKPRIVAIYRYDPLGLTYETAECETVAQANVEAHLRSSPVEVVRFVDKATGETFPPSAATP